MLTEMPVKGSTLETNWCKGLGLHETAELASQLQSEAQTWFLMYVEEALDCGFHFSCTNENGGDDNSEAKSTSQQESSQIALMLSQLKRVNDWVDQLESNKENPLEPKVAEVLHRLKRRIYEFLLQHVESAATALGKCV